MISHIAERWLLVVATWVLAIGTIWLVLDAKWSSQQQLRAYVYVNPREAFHIDGQGTLQVYSVIGNSGLTPATKVERFATLDVLPPTDFPAQRVEREAGITVLGPRSEIALVKNWARGQLTADQTQEIKEGTLRVYVFGKVLYDDVLGGHWEFDFCNAYFGREGFDHPEPTPVDPKHTSFSYLGWQAKPCDKGNEIKQRKLNRHQREY